MRVFLTIILFLLPTAAFAQPKEPMGPPRPVELRKLLTPADAQALALADLQRLPEAQRVLTRYIWNQEASAEAVKDVALTANYISRGTRFQPVPLAENRLVRIDLTQLCNDVEKDLPEIIETYELLRFDPRFNLLLTPDMLKVILALPVEKQPMALVKTAKGFESRALATLAEADVVRISATHLDPQVTLALQTATLSAAPIISREYFVQRVLRSIQGNNGLYKSVWGGLYYQFKGVAKSPKKGVTDLQFLFERLGAAGESRSDQRMAMGESGVTNKPRAIEGRATNTLRIGDGSGVVYITSDLRDDSFDASQDPFKSLDPDTFKPDGHEVIWLDRNGLLAFALYDGKGGLVDEAPHELVDDTTIPKNWPKRLESAASCLRCHAPSEGVLPARNEVMDLLANGFDVFGDASRVKESIHKSIRRTKDFYQGNLDKSFQLTRWTYQSAVLEIAGPWGGKPTEIIKNSVKRFEADNNAYWYDAVTPEKALRELGFEALPKETAIVFLKRLLRPDADSLANGIIPEDVTIARLLSKRPVGRQAWSLVYPFAQSRANKELARMLKEGKQP